MAISYDSVEILQGFADKYNITYPLLSDEESTVIKSFGILNTNIYEGHEWYGVPFPGTYMVGKDGLVFNKSFEANHRIRESANSMLQEDYKIQDAEHGEVQIVNTDHFSAKAHLSSSTIRMGQLLTVTVEVLLNEEMHVYGRPLPEGYIPVALTLEADETIEVNSIEYPEPAMMEFKVIQEQLPSYHGNFKIKARFRTMNEDPDDPFNIKATLRYQACDSEQCYLPQTIVFTFPLKFLPHDWDLIEIDEK